MFELFVAQLKWSWIQYKRYSHEIIGGVVALTVTFYGLFLSVGYIAGGSVRFGDRLDAVIVGYVLWSLVIFIMNGINATLQREAQVGTLEQLFISPFNVTKILLLRAVSDLILQSGLITLVLFIIMALTGRWLAFSPALILPLISVVLGAYGLAFAIGSLALIFKTVQQIAGILNFSLLFVLTIPTETWTGLQRYLGYLIPMTTGAGVMRDLMARQATLNWVSLGAAFLNGVVYFAIGLTLFRWSERETKRRGKLGGY
ncbi:MAG: ABC transporter permease [Plectolyngbya sp. WJT66-NPBG17]|jgi:ABC-2 type transport system permease protein|nr:ABC transporter permease [Plectolyngbya sp. WJT66-NPBG17]MBW4525306.1 ABC transporter permease [Phormidium tanganyikae FI6-MK23]